MDKKEKSRANFDRSADTYDTSSAYKFPRQCHPHILREIETIEYNSFLDVGCGTGVILWNLYGKNPAAQYCGLDISENMLSRARERLGTKANLTLGDSENLPYEDNTFDAVSCSESFHHYPNPQKALSEIKRVLKSKGKFVLCDTWVMWPFRPFINWSFRFNKDGDVHAYSRREITSLFRDAGFSDIKYHIITYHAYICTGIA